MDDLTIYRNFRIYNTGNSFIVRADSKRFGKSAIVYENFDIKKCIAWIYAHYRNNDGKVITNRGLVDKLYAQAMSTCKLENNYWYKEA